MAFLERVWRQAAQLGLRGWVGNAQDGQVEALFEGKAEAVRQMIKWFFSDSSCGVEVHFTSVRQETPRAISLASRSVDGPAPIEAFSETMAEAAYTL